MDKRRLRTHEHKGFRKPLSLSATLVHRSSHARDLSDERTVTLRPGEIAQVDFYFDPKTPD